MALWKHQEDALKWSVGRGSLALFWETGTGKTKTAYHISKLMRRSEAPLVIVTPMIVVENWASELAEEGVPPHRIIPLTGVMTKRIAALRKAQRNSVVILSYESLLNDTVFDLLKSLVAFQHSVLVFDESHKCKTPSTKRTKAAILLSQVAEHKILLSGTPVLKNQLDLWAQIKLIDGGDRLGDSYFAFRNRYFIDRNAWMPRQRHFPDFRLRPQAQTEISKLLESCCLSLKKQDCLDLPPLVRVPIFVDLGPDQRKVYDEMENDLVTSYKGGTCAAELAVIKALRLQQIVSGHIPVEGDSGQTTLRFETNPRKQALAELLESCIGSKPIVWAAFRQDYRTIVEVCEDARRDCWELHGEVDADTRQKNIKAWKESENGVLIANPVACGIGINLVESDVSIYYSRNFSLEADIQSEARNYRAGSECHTKVTRYDLIAKGTIDETVIKALQTKSNVNEALLQHLKGK